MPTMLREAEEETVLVSPREVALQDEIAHWRNKLTAAQLWKERLERDRNRDRAFIEGLLLRETPVSKDEIAAYIATWKRKGAFA